MTEFCFAVAEAPHKPLHRLSKAMANTCQIKVKCLKDRLIGTVIATLSQLAVLFAWQFICTATTSVGR